MEFNAKTLNALKNFAAINQSVLIKRGDVIRTVSATKSIMAKAYLDEVIEHDLAIYDLSNFLSALSMFDTVMEFDKKDDSYVRIRSKTSNQAFKYRFADPEILIVPPEQDLKLKDVVVEFDLKEKSITDVVKAIGILNLPEIAISGDGKHIKIEATSSKVDSSSYYEIIGETDKTFKAFFRAENLKMIPADYHVKLNKLAAHFSNSNFEYWVVVENSSEF